MDDKPPLKGAWLRHVTRLNFMASSISQKWLKLELSCYLNIMRLYQVLLELQLYKCPGSFLRHSVFYSWGIKSSLYYSECLQKRKTVACLARSAHLLIGLLLIVYIFLALISFFLFLNGRSENNYLRIYWTNLRNIFTEWMRFGCTWSCWYLMGRCHGNQFCGKNGELPLFVALAFRNRMGYRYQNVRINSVNYVISLGYIV